MVRYHIAVVGKLLLADAANAILGNDFPVKEFAHLPVGTQFPVSARVLRIVDAPDTQLPMSSFFRDCLPAAAGEGAVDWTDLVLAESHGNPPGCPEGN